MALSHKIRDFNETSGGILVSVHNSGGTEVGTVNIDLPMDEAGLYLVGDALTAYINSFIPEEHFTRLETVGGGVANASAITALLEPYPVPEVVQNITNAEGQILGDVNTYDILIDARLTHHSLI